jgi:arsenite methyltransferase
MNSIKESVKHYYSEVIKNSSDLKTSACCAGGAPPEWMKRLISKIDERVLERFYGCGYPITEAVKNCKVLDLGCGTGRDVYIYSQLVGALGSVIGIDMTEDQLMVANAVLSDQMQLFGYERPNVEFKHGYIEELASLDIKEGSVDLVVSNCVVNLSPDKEAVLRGVSSVLKQGGEFYFSDVFCDRRLSEAQKSNEMLYGECLGGALYIGDFISLAKRSGFRDPRLVSESPIELATEVQELTGAAQFVSRTYRLFKLDVLEDNCEDYGQMAIYKGGLAEAPHIFKLDDHHIFEKGRAERVCGNTADMLQLSRFAKYFDIVGEKLNHYGEFPCGNTLAADQINMKQNSSFCC